MDVGALRLTRIGCLCTCRGSRDEMMVTGTGGFLIEMLRLLLIGACAAIATAFSPASRLPAALNRGSVGSSLSLRPGGAPRLRVGATGVRCQAGGPPLDKEPLDLCEENVLQALEEAKEVSFFCIDLPCGLHGWVKRRGQRDRQVARVCYASPGLLLAPSQDTRQSICVSTGKIEHGWYCTHLPLCPRWHLLPFFPHLSKLCSCPANRAHIVLVSHPHLSD
jgi:hypothetical protein